MVAIAGVVGVAAPVLAAGWGRRRGLLAALADERRHGDAAAGGPSAGTGQR